MGINNKKIENKEQLLELIKRLGNEDSSSWESTTTKDFLEALGRWLKDADGFYRNLQLETNPNEASWQLFADAIQAAIVYE